MVYFVLCRTTMLVKIGKTANFRNRFASLSNSSPVPLFLIKTIPGDEREEREIHDRFHYLRHHGEWFMLANELIEYLENIGVKELLGNAQLNQMRLNDDSLSRTDFFWDLIKDNITFLDESHNFYNVSEVAKLLNVKRKILMSEINNLPIAYYRIGRNTIMIKPKEFNDYVREKLGA